jgi:dTDP-4-dehydrorhamnose reductase
MKILVLGASGMLGNAMMRVLAATPAFDVFGTVRSADTKRLFQPSLAGRLLTGVEVEQHDVLTKVFATVRPHVVINCVGVVKQRADCEDPTIAITLNSLLPHRLARLCELTNARLIHISTDCVFSGATGNYSEGHFPDAADLYGRSKLLGEVHCQHAITLRTSIIGHELLNARGLIGWFLAQEGTCKGYPRAIFSGFPAVVLAQITRDVVIPRPDLSGVYHVAAQPISKYDLLTLVAQAYGKSIKIIPSEEVVVDRSLNGERFRSATGYVPPPWPELIATMHACQGSFFSILPTPEAYRSTHSPPTA